MVGIPAQRPGPGAEPSLALLRELRTAARELYRREAASICDYVRALDGRTVVAREVVAESIAGLPADPTQHATCTCFVVAHLTERRAAHAPRSGAAASERQYLGSWTGAVAETVLGDFVALYRVVDGTASAATQVRTVKDTWNLPNWYNTPLHLSGVAAALRDRGGPAAAPPDVLALAATVAARVANWLSERGGYVPDIGQRRTPRNPFLTYWCVRSLTDWADLVGDSADPGLDEALRSALENNLDFMARILVANQAGIGSTFDAADLVCSLSVVALASRRLRRRDEYVASVLPHAVDVLLDAYVHRDGSFAPNTPVLEARASRRVITASSEELNAILVHALGHDLTARHLVRMQPALEHAGRKSSGPKGWGSSADTSPERRDAFLAAGALAFVRLYRDALDSSIARLCAQDLGVTPYVWDQALDAFAFPDSVRPVIEDRVLGLIRDEQRRDLALTSLVLGGPRSVAKDLIARKIAQELGWPIVVFDPASFVREGVSLESEVGRVLDLVNELSDTVVFFDGFDDTVDAFGQAPLRWSMLGRLDRVGARGRVLLIIGSTEPARVGLNTDRAGHFDGVFYIDKPGNEERQALLSRFFDRFGAENDVVEAFAEAAVTERTNGFTEGFLRELVRTCVGLKRVTGTIDAAAVERERQLMVHRLDTEEARSS